MGNKTTAEAYVSKVTKPSDFDDFWDGVLAQAAQVPLALETVPDPLRTTEDVEVFQVFFDSLDNLRVAAWYAVPRVRSGRLPGLLFVPGYHSDPPIPTHWARLGYATLSVAPRGKLRSNRQFNPGYPGLLTYGIVDRNAYSYRGFYLDAWRGIDYLLGADEVDSSRIGVTGSSQGGGLTITTSAMRPEVTAAADAIAKAFRKPAVWACASIKPLDEAQLTKLFKTYAIVATVEEHGRVGGFGAAVAEWLVDQRGSFSGRLIRFATPDEFLHESGEQEHARKLLGLTGKQIASSLLDLCDK